VPETERYYESTLVIRASTDLTTVLKWPPEILQSFNEFASKLPRKSNAFQHSGFLLDIDVTKEGPRRRPSRFALDRRAGMPFEKNIFFTQSPFPTDDHIAFLEAIERLASR
jgi:hypothetical protein